MTSSENRLNASINLFGSELFRYLRKDGGNLIVSPFGVQVLLAMMLEGADGKTAKEISKTLHHSKNDKEILEGYKDWINSLESPSLKIATKIFVEKAFEIKANFISSTREYFLSEIERKDFCKSSEDSRLDINKWAEEKTNYKIKDLLPEGSIPADAGLVMVNVIHFYAQWKTQFDKQNTVDMPFYITSNKQINVKMMVASKQFLFVECKKLNAKIIKLLYEDERFSIIIILPNKLDGLPEIENKLRSIDLLEELSTLHPTTVNLMLPRFYIEKTMDLNDWLMKQMPTLFTDKANLSGITDGFLGIGKIIQKAFVEVNESGTEATASTGVVIATRSLKIVPDMKCDHPFLFLIVKDGLVLFRGVLTEPNPERV